MSDAPRRILIVNAVALNAGDAAILLGELEGLRRAFGGAVRFQVAEDDPETARRLYPDIDFVPALHFSRRKRPRNARERLARSARRRRISMAVRLLAHSPALAERLLDERAREHLERMRRADAVVGTGGTYFVEHYSFRARADELIAAQSLGRPTYLYTQSMGPFRRMASRRTMRRVLSRARRVFLRDHRSRDHAAEVGAPRSQLEVHADAAFALAPTGREAVATSAPGVQGSASDVRGEGRRSQGHGGEGPGGKRPSVAISVRHWRHFGDRPSDQGLRLYREAVASLVRWLRERGATVTFVSTCQGVNEYWTDDSRFARRLVDELLPDLDGVDVDDRFRAPDALIDRLAEFDLVVATRMHMAILALCAGVPVVPIAYEFKTTELFAGLGMDELVEPIETIEAASLRARVERALDQAPALRERVAAAVARLSDEAIEPARRIAADLGAADGARHEAGAA